MPLFEAIWSKRVERRQNGRFSFDEFAPIWVIVNGHGHHQAIAWDVVGVASGRIIAVSLVAIVAFLWHPGFYTSGVSE